MNFQVRSNEELTPKPVGTFLSGRDDSVTKIEGPYSINDQNLSVPKSVFKQQRMTLQPIMESELIKDRKSNDMALVNELNIIVNTSKANHNKMLSQSNENSSANVRSII